MFTFKSSKSFAETLKAGFAQANDTTTIGNFQALSDFEMSIRYDGTTLYQRAMHTSRDTIVSKGYA